MKSKHKLVPLDNYIILTAKLFSGFIFIVSIFYFVIELFYETFNIISLLTAVTSISLSAIVTQLQFIVLNWDRDYIDKK